MGIVSGILFLVLAPFIFFLFSLGTSRVQSLAQLYVLGAAWSFAAGEVPAVSKFGID